MSLGFLALIVGLGAVLLFGSNLAFEERRLPEGLQLLLRSGLLFVLLGAGLGPQGLGLVTQTMLTEQLSPILEIALGWIGFLYGTHFEWRRMRRFPLPLFFAGFTESILTAALVCGAAYYFLPLLIPGLPPQHLLAMTMALGLCAAGTAPAGVFMLQRRRELSRQNVEAMLFFSAMDDLPALILLGTVFVFWAPVDAALSLSGLTRMSIGAGGGVILGYVLHWIFPRTGSSRHNALVIFGITAFGAGFAELLRVSPLTVTTIAGIVFTNLSHLKERAYGVFAARESELYAIFLFIAGASFHFQGGSTVLIGVPALVLSRALGKLCGGFLARQLFLSRARISRDIGLGLLFQGGMTLAIATHLERSYTSFQGPLMTTVVLAVVVNDIIATPIAVWAMKWERGREVMPEVRAS